MPEVLLIRNADRGLLADFAAVPGVDQDIQVVRTGVKLDGAAPAVDSPPPVLGQDNAEIYGDLSLTRRRKHCRRRCDWPAMRSRWARVRRARSAIGISIIFPDKRRRPHRVPGRVIGGDDAFGLGDFHGGRRETLVQNGDLRRMDAGAAVEAEGTRAGDIGAMASKSLKLAIEPG